MSYLPEGSDVIIARFRDCIHVCHESHLTVNIDTKRLQLIYIWKHDVSDFNRLCFINLSKLVTGID